MESTISRSSARALGPLLILLLCLALPARAQTLAHVSVTGTQTVQADQVIIWSGLKLNESISSEGVAAAIRRLFATGKFSDVYVYSNETALGIDLILNVSEFPRLADLQWEGLKKLKREDLEEKMPLRVGDHLSPARVRRGLESVREAYRAEGYYNASVEPDSSAFLPGSSRVLVIRVVEGSKVKVRRILVEGNEALTDEEVRDGFSTKEDNWFRGGTFKLPEFEADLAKIAANYQNRGFLDAEVVSHDLAFVESSNKLDITIQVREGDSFRVGAFSWSGNQIQADERIAPLMNLREGETWDESAYVEIQRNLHNLYWEDGYIYAQVRPDKEIHGDRVDVHFTFVEGGPARVRLINIVGNTKTHEKVIRRELRMLPGDVFRNTTFQDSQRRIFQLGYFSDLRPDVQEIPGTQDVDITLEVEEKQTGNFTMGVGFSQQTRASGFFNVGENNLLGRGQSVNFAWQFGSRRNFLDLSYTEPWFMGTPTLVGADVFNRFSNRVNDFFDTRQKGFALRLGRPIPGTRFSRFTVRYGLTQTTLRNFDPYYVQILDQQEELLGVGQIEFERLDEVDWPQTTSGITLSLTRNSTDSPFFPSQGSRSTARFEINGGMLGGDLDYHKLQVDYDMYRPLPAKFAFHLGAFAGSLRAYGATESVPDYERFRLGGNRFYSLRGYRDLEVVPTANADFPFIGGTFFTTFTTELLFPVTQSVILKGFVDQGDTWNSFSEADLTNLRTGAGLGISLEVPLIGRIGLDYGYGFDKADPGWEAHFNFGTIF
jgi:outer membrane protein insertion porin family